MTFAITPIFLYAAYNPFFSETKPAEPVPTVQQIIVEPRPKADPIPKRQNIKMTYFGFVESKKGKFALVAYNRKKIVIRQQDSLYSDEQIFKVKKITSNYILLTDRHSRVQTVYFSSETERSQQWQK